MIRNNFYLLGLIFIIFCAFSCQSNKKVEEKKTPDSVMQRKLANYAKVKLSADLSALSPNQIKLFSHLIKAANAIDEVYWLQAYGNKEELLNGMIDPHMREYAMINYGPWDRLDGFTPFTEDFPPRPLGIGFFPTDLNQEEFFNLNDDNKYNPFTTLKREASGNLQVVPYKVAYQSELNKAATHLNNAAQLAESESFKTYLQQRAKDLLVDNFHESDHLWMNLTDNVLDFIAGPIVNTGSHDLDEILLWCIHLIKK